MIKPKEQTVTFLDVTQSRRFETKVSSRDSVARMVDEGRRGLGLEEQNPDGSPMRWHAFSNRMGRHLMPTEQVGDVLDAEREELVLQPDVMAGGNRDQDAS